MIGVTAKAHQRAAVDEFFQLFKTPWEECRRGGSYDVVVATSGETPEVEARLLVIYGADVNSSDARYGVRRGSVHRGGVVAYRGVRLPISGEVVTFEPGSG